MMPEATDDEEDILGSVYCNGWKKAQNSYSVMNKLCQRPVTKEHHIITAIFHCFN